jgi:starch synthase (maltosyl-transferring)
VTANTPRARQKKTPPPPAGQAPKRRPPGTAREDQQLFPPVPAGDARGRVVIARVTPQIEGGRFPIKRTVGEPVRVEADVFADGHDALACWLLYRSRSTPEWLTAPMRPLVNDRWRGQFTIERLEPYEYTLAACVDHFRTWQRDLRKRVQARQDVAVELQIGAARLLEAATILKSTLSLEANVTLALSEELASLMTLYVERRFETRYARRLQVQVDPVRARYSTWYEMFPRSSTDDPQRHGTLRDCEALLPYVQHMGFDVLYLPPIHPIGHDFRKGPDNTLIAQPDDVGSPWAIGSAEGGHKAVHPALGTLEDFRRLVSRARAAGIEVALDLAFQCAPDHPYVREHPEWFTRRPDGTIQYAENPPKKYQDIFPLNFETDAWRELWEELRSVVLFWIEQGVRIFRVDNPHTKPFAFWEWLISGVRRAYPDVFFLAEAFTRPKVMQRLAQIGFAQSYTYFAWRNTKYELEQYFTQLTQTQSVEYFRPNLWPNTPDILTEYLQIGGRAAFMARLALAATLGASYGIYGPAFELCENQPREPGSEEYLHTEKYQIRVWNRNDPASLKEFIARVNRIRRENSALHHNRGLRFHSTDNENLICYSKSTEDGEQILVMVVNLDPHHRQVGHVLLALEQLTPEPPATFQAHDLLSGARYLWQAGRNYVELDPASSPAHIFRLRRRVRTEHDFDYYL